MLRNIHRLLYSFWCLECWKWHFQASRFKNFLGGACLQTPLEDGALRPLNCNSRLLLFYHLPTSNFIENPGKAIKTRTECMQLTQSAGKQNKFLKKYSSFV